MATSRTTLRQTVGDRLGDMTLLEATHASASPDTFKDVIRLGDRGDGAPSLLNKIAYLTLAADPTTGHEARITDYTSADRTLTFTPEAPSTPDVADQCELWSVTERIGSISTLHRLFNAGVRAVADEAGVEVWDTAQSFNARSPQLTIPSTWVEFGGVDWTDRQGYAHEWPADEDHLLVRPGLRTVELRGRTAWRANMRNVRLWGYARPTEMTADSGTNGETEVNAEWLVESVLAWMAIRAISNASELRAPSQERIGSFWAQQATQYRRYVGVARRGLGITLP